MEAEDILPVLSEQLRELAVADAVDMDYDAAYKLQLQEAINAYLNLSPSRSGSSSYDSNSADFSPNRSHELQTIYQQLSREISDYEQRLSDHETAKKMLQIFENDINRENHDHAFAQELLKVPEAEWERTGELLQKPYFDGSTVTNYCRDGLISLDRNYRYRVHIKGLLCQVKGSDEGENLLAGIGVAVCDPWDEMILEVSKNVVRSEGLSYEFVQLNALVECFHVINSLGIRRITIVCCNKFLYNCVTGKWHPEEESSSSSLGMLLDEVTNLQKKLIQCGASLVQEKDLKFASELAQKAVASQLSMDGTVEIEDLTTIINRGNATEMCSICLENVWIDKMFSIHGCGHEYCFDCMNKHVEHRLLHQGSSGGNVMPTCPHVGCKIVLELEDSRKFLKDELLAMILERLKEVSIPPSDKIYCPNPICSNLMSISELSTQAGTSSDGANVYKRTCMKCRGEFCMNCKVPWHGQLSCRLYKIQKPYPSPEEGLVMSLAANKRWKQCPKCKNMVSLSHGCNHIYCRCGHEFCYVCGAEWKDKKPTCGCKLWEDESRIIYN